MKGECLVKEIQMKNFRSLKDTGMQTLSPITILVGENSSGKSTFLRAFPLLKQSISKRTSGPILWAGDVDDYVDFGSFEETVTNDGSDDIAFGFCFSIGEREAFEDHYFSSLYNKKSDSLSRNIQVKYEIKIASKEGKDHVSALILTINAFRVEFDLINKTISTNGGLSYSVPKRKDMPKNVEIKGAEYYLYFRTYCTSFGFSLPEIDDLWNSVIKKIQKSSSNYEGHLLVEASVLVGALLTESTSVTVPKVDQQKVNAQKIGAAQRLPEFYFHIADLIKSDQTGKTAEIFKLCYVYDLFSTIDEYIYTYFKQVHYMAPLRATAERYYRLRNLAVDEVDYQGKNLPIFINSLTTEQHEQFKAWTEEHFGFTVDTDKSGGHLSLQIKLKGSDKKINLSDTGFGYSQVLPIITQMWELSALPRLAQPRYYRTSNSLPLVIAIEQPELHLHPAIQARLAKAFIACIDLARKNKRELQLIIETHSETIVNYFGRAIARKQLKPEDISVIIFEKESGDGSTNVLNSTYDEDGFLTNWPYGFFESEE